MSTDRTAEDLDRMADEARLTRAQLGGTLDALCHRLDPQTLKRQVNDMMRSTDGSTGLAETLKANPIPLAMIGIGIGWLLLGAGGGSGYGGQVRDWADRNTRGARSRVQQAMDRVSETAHDAADRASGTLQSMRERVTGEHGSATPHPAGPAGDHPARDVTGTHGARGAHDGLADGSGHRLSAMGEIRRSAERSAGGFWHLVDDYPLAAGLMGLALGAAIGAAIPSTETENEWVGDWGDQIRARGSEVGADLLERGSAIAQAAIHGGVEAAQAGLGHEGGPDDGR